VALIHESEQAPNVDLDGRAAGAFRYTRENTPVLDANTGAGEHTVGGARPNLSILFGDERRDGFDTVRIAQITRAATGAPTLRETFIPPVLTVSAAGYLVSRFRKLLSSMTAKQRSLADSRRQRTKAAVDFQASDTAKFWMLNALNQSIPAISHIVDHSTTAEQAYLHLAQLIGTLCTFAVEGDPTTTPKFNFLELGDVFEPMFERAHTLLDAVLAERYVEIPLKKREDGMFLGQISDAALLRHSLFVAAIGGNVPEGQLRDRMPKLAKIASWGQIGAILNSAVNGIRLELEYTPPAALPVKPGLLFFKVVRTPEYWNDIAGTGTIAIYQPIDPLGVELHLYAVDPTNLQ
jgi:type VI secretion system protein ImpJ